MAFVCALIGACAWGDGSPGGGDGDGGDDDPMQMPAPVCGDGTCAGPEVGVCTADCGGGSQAPKCGNSSCENGENSTNCPSDCPAQSQCGNGTCDAGETTGNCAGDCPAPSNCPSNPLSCFLCASEGFLCPSGQTMASCEQCIIIAGGGLCSGGFPNTVCEPPGETMTNCPFDCM